MSPSPIIAITMGDGAGIGPEVIVKALSDPDLDGLCRPFVIGDPRQLRRAIEICGVNLDLHVVTAPDPAQLEAGAVNVIDAAPEGPMPNFGELSAIAGEGAYRYIVRACEYAMSGAVAAICTAPLNKEALQLAGHHYPGHTELLAALTGTDEVSMMLVTDHLRVLHVTTHIGLRDAIDRIEPGLVQRTLERGYRTLVTAGIPKPIIAVCGINPHAGENGLFGHHEEEEKVAPGIEAARAEGIDARGPLPADTLFFRAIRGDFDLVVAMYHDQGHAPVKALGLDSGVNVTVGLPVIRTSVDHGTAFDIAGTGAAQDESMVQALREAVKLVPSAPTLGAPRTVGEVHA